MDVKGTNYIINCDSDLKIFTKRQDLVCQSAIPEVTILYFCEKNIAGAGQIVLLVGDYKKPIWESFREKQIDEFVLLHSRLVHQGATVNDGLSLFSATTYKPPHSEHIGLPSVDVPSDKPPYQEHIGFSSLELCGLYKKSISITASEVVIKKEKSILSRYLEKHIPITHVVGIYVHQQGKFSHGFIQIQTVEQKYSSVTDGYQYAKNATQATSDENAMIIDVNDADGYRIALQIKDFIGAELLKNAEECAIIQEEMQEQMQEQQRVRLIEEQEQNDKLQQEQLFQMQQEQLKVQQEQLRLQQKQMDEMARCPRCGSTSLSGHKKGFGIGKAVVGATVANVLTFGMATPIGLVAGNIGAKKVRVTCLKCGKQFMA